MRDLGKRRRSVSATSRKPRFTAIPRLLPFPVLLSGCEALRFGVVNHAGPVAADQWNLYLIVGAVLIFVAGPVLLLVPLIAYHYRLANKNGSYRPTWDFSWSLEGLIWIPPAGIVIGLGFVLWHYSQRLDPYRPIASTAPPIEVQAVGFDWKWLFIYPDQRVAAVNQLAIPVGRPVHVSLTSGTVMQSLLIPQLAGQIYAMPAMRTQLNLAASRPGVFRGGNTQFNGLGFQNQKFEVIALPEDDYARWLERVRGASRPLDDRALDALFAKSSVSNAIFFSATPPTLFEHIMDRSQEPKR